MPLPLPLGLNGTSTNQCSPSPAMTLAMTLPLPLTLGLNGPLTNGLSRISQAGDIAHAELSTLNKRVGLGWGPLLQMKAITICKD